LIPNLKWARHFAGQPQVKPPLSHPGAGVELLPVAVAVGRDTMRPAGCLQAGQAYS